MGNEEFERMMLAFRLTFGAQEVMHDDEALQRALAVHQETGEETVIVETKRGPRRYDFGKAPD